MAKPGAFVDSSVVIAALLSPEGGSFRILTECQDLFAFQINEYVLAETQEVLRSKFRDRPSPHHRVISIVGDRGHLGSAQSQQARCDESRRGRFAK